jgi:hypothetical protein
MSLVDDSGSIQIYLDKAVIDGTSGEDTFKWVLCPLQTDPAQRLSRIVVCSPLRPDYSYTGQWQLQSPAAPYLLYISRFQHIHACRNLKSLIDAGDIIGARGGIKRTEKGELSVNAAAVQVLTKSLMPLPDKWHGLADIEKRYRQRCSSCDPMLRSLHVDAGLVKLPDRLHDMIDI